jgi:small conductance mechanosensitive channel
MEENIVVIQRIVDMAVDFFVNYSFNVIGAIIIIALGYAFANYASGIINKLLKRKKLDDTITKFLVQIIKLLIIGFAVITAMGKFGISVAPIIAGLTAMIFGASFAVQGLLSNYGAGLSIIFTRSFSVGDTITVKNVNGIVEQIKLGYTVIRDEDGVSITIPNKHIVGEILFNSLSVRIVEEVVGVSYDSDPARASEIILKVLGGIPEVSQNPAPRVGIQTFGDSSINIGYRYWAPSGSHFRTRYKVNLAVFEAFKEAHVEIPFPQRVVHMVPR